MSLPSFCHLQWPIKDWHHLQVSVAHPILTKGANGRPIVFTAIPCGLRGHSWGVSGLLRRFLKRLWHEVAECDGHTQSCGALMCSAQTLNLQLKLSVSATNGCHGLTHFNILQHASPDFTNKKGFVRLSWEECQIALGKLDFWHIACKSVCGPTKGAFESQTSLRWRLITSRPWGWLIHKKQQGRPLPLKEEKWVLTFWTFLMNVLNFLLKRNVKLPI